MDIKNKQEIVTDLLTTFPHLRDDGNKLLATIWKIEIQMSGEDIREMSGFDLLSRIADSELSTHESISRASRKIQEEVPTLRGEKWLKRHNSQSNVVTQLHEMEFDLNK